MPSVVHYNAEKNIVYVKHVGIVTLDDRVRAIKEIAALCPGERRILTDVREMKEFVSMDTVDAMVANDDLNRFRFHKVAVLHKASFNPYVVLASMAVLNGMNLEDFTSLEQAERWLQA